MIASLVAVLVIAYIAIAMLMYLVQPRLLYAPSSALYQTPADSGLTFEEVHLRTTDSVQLHSWFIPSPVDGLQQTLLFLHGNGGNIGDRLDSLTELHRLGFSVLIIDYRGYGRSDGKPDELGTYADARAAWEYLTITRGIAHHDIIAFGRSLGGAVAVQLASEVTAGGLIVESSFTTLPRLAQRLYPWLPAKYLTRFKYASIERATAVRCPVLVIHSPDDKLIPFDEGVSLYNAFESPKEFFEISGDHASGFAATGAPYWDTLGAFAARIRRDGPAT